MKAAYADRAALEKRIQTLEKVANAAILGYCDGLTHRPISIPVVLNSGEIANKRTFETFMKHPEVDHTMYSGYGCDDGSTLHVVHEIDSVFDALQRLVGEGGLSSKEALSWILEALIDRLDNET